MDNFLYLIVLLSVASTIGFFFIGTKYTKQLYSLYETSIVKDVSSDLKNNFSDASPKLLLTLSLFSTLLAIVFFGFFLGFVGALFGGVIGLSAPWVYQKIYNHRRLNAFIYQLPDALSSLSSSLRAGRSLIKGLEMLAKRQPAPLSQEFSLVINDNRLGRELEDSLRDMAKRLNCAELDLFTTTVIIARNVGGNLADTLDSLADTLREKAQIEGKVKALTAMGRMQGWVVSLLPVGVGVMIYSIEPEKMSVLYTQWWGWVLVAIMLSMMGLAVWMIQKIVNIDV